MRSNKVWMLVFLLLSYVFLVGVAGAQERVRVFERTSGPSFGEFQTLMQEAGLLDGDRVATSVLGRFANLFAQANDYLRLVPASNRSEESYVELFKRWNGLGETITLAEFRRKGQGAGFWLPIARPVARTHATTALSATELVQSLRDLQQEVEGLTGAGQGEVTLLRKRVTNLSVQLGELTTSNASLQGALDLLEERLAGDLSPRALSTDTVIEEVTTRLESEIGSLNFGFVYSSFGKTADHEDTFYGFRIAAPDEWKVEYAKDAQSSLRMIATSPTQNNIVYLYAWKVESGVFRASKLADDASKLFNNLGPKRESKRVEGGYEVTFDRNTNEKYSKVLFFARDNYAYALVAFSEVNDFFESQSVFSSFKITNSFNIMTQVFFLGSLSLVLHLYFIHHLFFSESFGIVVKSVIKWEVDDGVVLAFCFLLVLVAINYFVIEKLFGAFMANGVGGLFEELYDIGPHLFSAASHLIAAGMAFILRVGFWPGGSVGLVLTTFVSVVLNYFEVNYIIKSYWNKFIAIREGKSP